MNELSQHTQRPNTTLSPLSREWLSLDLVPDMSVWSVTGCLSPPPAANSNNTKIPPKLTKQKYNYEIRFHSKGGGKHSVFISRAIEKINRCKGTSCKICWHGLKRCVSEGRTLFGIPDSGGGGGMSSRGTAGDWPCSQQH